ncbi:MAG: hypothetical protein J6Y54_06505 [Lentisphaeria bacterium]|nr:hypothetical protein [Lentisphaeria bacterium]
MKKLFLVLMLACCIMPRALGSPPTLSAFSAKWTPLQIIVLPFALFNEATPVYGLNLTTFGGFHSKVYGISCGLVQNSAIHVGVGVGIGNATFNNYGLMLGGLNASIRNPGVAVGIANVCTTDPAVWIPTSDNFLQIGLFNSATNGLQIGLLNHNPNAIIPWMVLFNYSPRERRTPTPQSE